MQFDALHDFIERIEYSTAILEYYDSKKWKDCMRIVRKIWVEILGFTEREAEYKPFVESIGAFSEVFSAKWKTSVQFGDFLGTLALSPLGALENCPDTRDVLRKVREDELSETLCTIARRGRCLRVQFTDCGYCQ